MVFWDWIKYFFLFWVFFLGPFPVGAGPEVFLKSRPEFQWPLQQNRLPAIRGVTSTFGESRGDHFHNGVDIAGKNKPVVAVADARVVYFRAMEHDPFFPVTGPGNYVFLAHEGGWWSGYYHLQTVAGRQKRRVKAGGYLGDSGNSGRSMGAHLHFFIAAEHGGVFVNPLEVLPPVVDDLAPELGVPFLNSANVLQVAAVDPGLGAARRGVYRLFWQWNDEPENRLVFRYLSFVRKNWRLNGLYSFDDVYQAGFYRFNGLPVRFGKYNMSIMVADYAGNQTTKSFVIAIEADQ